ncbi:MAG: hypothetical protein RIR26_1662 [Pseudomonadota bacterium]|jgi:3-isopropylmalate/(R)-2-methylmalate dehydratase small subunit
MSFIGWTQWTGVPVIVSRDNIDTDQIYPGRFLSLTDRAEMKEAFFADWRLRPMGEVNPDSPFTPSQSVLVAGENFGCGSSREHAVWVMADWGYRAVLARSFAPIFRQNALSNGLVPIVISAEMLSFCEENRNSILNMAIDLQSLSVTVFGHGSSCLQTFSFELDPFDVHCLRNGLDTLSFLRSHADTIDSFVSKKRSQIHSLNVFNSGGHAP